MIHRFPVSACLGFASLFWASGLTVWGREGRPYSAYPVASGVELDGRLTDTAWKTLPETGGFSPLSAPDMQAGKQTAFRIGWDQTFLYIGVKCSEPDIAKVNSRMKDGDDINLDDSLEIFLAPFYPAYHQLMVNTIGSRRWMRGGYNWQAATSRDQASWSAEIKIPFTELGKKPVDGDEWRFNISRNINVYDSGGEHFSTWAPLMGRFNDIERFGTLKFVATPLTEGEAEGMTRANREESLRSALAEIHKLEALCREALSDFGGGGRRIQWEQALEAIRRTLAEDVTAEKVRTARESLEKVNKEILELKIRLLLE